MLAYKHKPGFSDKMGQQTPISDNDRVNINNDNGLPYLSMQTDDYVDRTARLEAWRTAIGRVFDVSDPVQSNCEVKAAIQAWYLGDVVLGEVNFHAQEFRRSQATMRRSPMDHFLIQYYRSGGYNGQTETHALYCRPGEVSWLDLAHAVQTQAEESRTISLLIPHDTMRSAMPEADLLHGRIVYGSLGRLLGEYLEATLRVLPTTTQNDVPHIVTALCEMAVACTRPKREALMRAQPQINRTRLEQARRFIEQHLLSAKLDVDQLCGELLISRRQAYRLFEHLGGIAHYIQRRRLAHAYAVLTDPGLSVRISTLATRYGFSSESIFSKAFRREFGFSPRDAREAGDATVFHQATNLNWGPQDASKAFSESLGRISRSIR